MNMANMKTRTKILAVIGILAIVAVGISTASIWALKRLSWRARKRRSEPDSGSMSWR